MNILDDALAFAKECHEGQFRKYTGEPYFVHPCAVVEIVKTVPHTKEMLVAAALHDVVEDTHASFADVSHRFGHRVAAIVDELTEVELLNSVNRKTRKRIAAVRIRSWEAQTIKCADLIDNTKTIAEHDPKFAVTYLEEKAEALRMFDRADEKLLQAAWQSVDWAKGQL